MRLSELKKLVDAATERAEKFRCDPLVVTVDFRSGMQRTEAGDDEELRHIEEAGLIEMRSLEAACSNLEYTTREGMFANHPVFYITADDTTGVL